MYIIIVFTNSYSYPIYIQSKNVFKQFFHQYSGAHAINIVYHVTDRASALNEVKRYWKKEIVQNFGDDTDHCLPIMLIAAKADLAKSTFDE